MPESVDIPAPVRSATLLPRSSSAACAMGADSSAVLDALEHCRDARGVYRFRNDHQLVLGRRP